MTVNKEDSIDYTNKPIDVIAEHNGSSESSLARLMRDNRNIILPRGTTPFDTRFLEKSRDSYFSLDKIKEKNPNFISIFDISTIVPTNYDIKGRKGYETPYCQNKFMANGFNTIGNLVTAIANYMSIVCYDKVILFSVVEFLNDNGISAEYSEQQQHILLPDIKL